MSCWIPRNLDFDLDIVPEEFNFVLRLMDSNNWRPTQPVETEMDAVDWRDQLSTDSRQKIVNKMMETLKRHIPCSDPDGTNELRKIAIRFEDKIYRSSVNQTDYLRKISMKMITVE